MAFNSELMKQLSLEFGPSGDEEGVRAIITEAVKPYVDSIETDSMGNLIVLKKGKGSEYGQKILIMAHMDEIGTIVTDIDKTGALKFSEVGGLNPDVCLGQRIVFQNGIQGTIGTSKGEDKDKNEIKDMFIDIGALSKEEAEKMISIGDCCVFNTPFYETEKMVQCKCADDRVGCYTLIELIKCEIDSVHDVYYVFTVQEEVGARGAKPIAFAIDPDVALAVDVTICGESLEDFNESTKVGGGAAIKVKDGSVICHQKVREQLIQFAEDEEILYQLEVMDGGGTDVGPAHLTRSGIPSGGVSIPTRYIHSPSEWFSKSDVGSCIELLKAFIVNWRV